MGKSRTAIYQVGKWYKVDGLQSLAESETNGYVNFKVMDINNPFVLSKVKKQKYRI